MRHLRLIGYQASGFISDDDPATAVRAESPRHHYDEVILATGRHSRSAGTAGPAPLLAVTAAGPVPEGPASLNRLGQQRVPLPNDDRPPRVVATAARLGQPCPAGF